MVLMLAHLVPTFGLNGGPYLVTVDGGRSLDSLIMVLVWVGVFHAVTQLTAGSQAVLLLYVLAGMALNLVFSFLQFSSTGFAENFQLLPYKINAGFFENENHLAALFYLSVPIIVAVSKRIGIRFLEVPLLAALLGFQFVIGSRAGLALILMSILLSYAMLSPRRWISLTLASVTAVAGALMVWQFVPDWWSTGGPLSRSVFSERALQAAFDHFPVGVGFGNFQLIYPSYESATIIVSQYVNHAHNDYLELFLEGSLLAGLLILGYFALIVRRCFTGHLADMQKAALIGILFVSIHSMVDYPLRTLGLGIVFAVLNAIIFSSPSKNVKNRDDLG
ncbi:MAG: hypothetical protein GY947_22260 [Rhodobacteraceae bacterium]|nr:hypothetical protein [Paracoccaceae bacterium]